MSIPPEIFIPKEGYRQISPSEISSLKLGKFLTCKGLNLRGNFSYPNIFLTLEQLPRDEQERFLVGFYTEGVKDFPNAERFAKELARINNIELFKPREEPDTDLLQELVNQHLESLGLQKAKVHITKDWFEADDAEFYAMDNEKVAVKCDVVKLAVGSEKVETEYTLRTTAGEAAWYTPRDIPRAALGSAVLDAVWSVVLNKTRGMETETDVAGDLAGNLAWIIAEDEMAKKGNPFTPLVAIYELGFLPIGLVENAKGKMEFAIFIPPIQPRIE